MKKKKIVVGILVSLLLFFVVGVACIFFYYQSSLQPVDRTTREDITVIVNMGTSSKEVIDTLYNAGLIKDKNMAYVYLKLHDEYVLQAGEYKLNKSMSLEDIFKKLNSGVLYKEGIKITFVEGKRVPYFAKQISSSFSYSEEEILNKMSDPVYLEQLIKKYWFLTDAILTEGIYYPLEGYLYPNTYTFEKEATIEDILEKILDNTEIVLNDYKEDILNSSYTIHEILTMASIVELEGANSDDREGVSGVFYNRLESGWSLGSDVTTYYAVQVDMAERDLYLYELNDQNLYNTRSAYLAGKLPVSAICNPGKESIEAAIHPQKHDYYYFVADKNKKTHFTKSSAEHQAKIDELKSQGLWYNYD